MTKHVFINLPVQDLDRTRAFWQALGFSFKDELSNDKAICLNISDGTQVMLIHRDFFQTWTPKPVADATRSTEVMVSLAAESPEAVDALIAAALAQGVAEPRPLDDLGWMASRSFEDLDGHIWEVAWYGTPDGPA